MESSRSGVLGNFTPRAMRVIALAHIEARTMKVCMISSITNIFCLLTGRGEGVAVWQEVGNEGLNLENVRTEVKKQVGIPSGLKTSGRIPFTPRTKKVFEMAKQEAKLLNHAYIGTEHLLLGLLSESEGLAARVFKNFNVNIEQTRKKILNVINPDFPSGDGTQEK